MSTNIENLLCSSVIKHGIEILSRIQANPSDIENYLTRILEEKLHYPTPLDHIEPNYWFMPSEYRNMDIEEYLTNQCPKDNYERLNKELEEYRKRNLLDLLRQMKYIVDILRENNIIWGVGRGSSVASYVLFLLGVHKIDSVKYNLPLEEFFKET